jgi:glycosyltransferase involved in cell wall biosynthesis
MPVRRVLMTGDAVGGVWTYSLHLAAGLARAGVAVDLAVLGPEPDDLQRAAARGIPGLTLWTVPFKLEWMDDAADDVARSGAWLLELEARTAPDVVHLGGYAHGALPFAAPKVVFAHSCVLSWWWAVHGEAPPPRWDGYAAAVRRGLGGADQVIAPSAAMLRALERHYGPLRAPSAVIPHGLPSARASRAAKRKMVFAAGRIWDAGKNIATLVAAAPEIPLPISIAGERALDPSTRLAPDAPTRGMAASVRSVRSVRYLGRLSAAEMAAAYRRAAIYAMPARYEPFGLTVLEAARHGCALVLGDIESLRENWDGAALFVRPGDAAGLARAIRSLVSDPGAQRRLAEEARRRARRFTLEAMCGATTMLYERIADGRSSSRRDSRALTPIEETPACAS